jgi:hypothetical protein
VHVRHPSADARTEPVARLAGQTICRPTTHGTADRALVGLALQVGHFVGLLIRAILSASGLFLGVALALLFAPLPMQGPIADHVADGLLGLPVILSTMSLI